MESVFHKLREKGTSTILKVIVDDRKQPAHDDAAIEKALKGLSIEVWDWMKVDICPELIFQTAPNITEVHLYWSGTNAVLRAWSEEEGLPMLKKLNKVELHVLQVWNSFNFDGLELKPAMAPHRSVSTNHSSLLRFLVPLLAHVQYD